MTAVDAVTLTGGGLVLRINFSGPGKGTSCPEAANQYWPVAKPRARKWKILPAGKAGDAEKLH